MVGKVVDQLFLTVLGHEIEFDAPGHLSPLEMKHLCEGRCLLLPFFLSFLHLACNHLVVVASKQYKFVFLLLLLLGIVGTDFGVFLFHFSLVRVETFHFLLVLVRWVEETTFISVVFHGLVAFAL